MTKSLHISPAFMTREAEKDSVSCVTNKGNQTGKTIRIKFTLFVINLHTDARFRLSFVIRSRTFVRGVLLS